MNELFDIVEPVQAAAQGSHQSLLIATAMLLVSSVWVGLRWWLKNKNRLRTLRQLRRLQRDFAAGRATSRTLAYAIAAELQRCLQTNRVCTARPVAARNDTPRDGWSSFVGQLDTLRYQPGRELDPQHVAALLREAAYWARRSR